MTTITVKSTVTGYQESKCSSKLVAQISTTLNYTGQDMSNTASSELGAVCMTAEAIVDQLFCIASGDWKSHQGGVTDRVKCFLKSNADTPTNGCIQYRTC